MDERERSIMYGRRSVDSIRGVIRSTIERMEVDTTAVPMNHGRVN